MSTLEKLGVELVLPEADEGDDDDEEDDGVLDDSLELLPETDGVDDEDGLDDEDDGLDDDCATASDDSANSTAAVAILRVLGMEKTFRCGGRAPDSRATAMPIALAEGLLIALAATSRPLLFNICNGNKRA